MKIPVEERKKYVISLRKRGYKEREIAKELHMSTRDVTKILKENEREEKEKKRLFSSKRSEALRLYKKVTKPLDVAIELDISAEAKAFYHEYLSLESPPQFLQVYTELNNTNSFNSFTHLFHLLREKGLSIEEAIEGIEMINDISLLKEEYGDLSNKVANLKELRNSLKIDNSFLTNQIAEMEIRLNSILGQIEMKEKALEIIRKILRQKQEEISKINSGEDYFKAREKIKLLVEEFLGNRKNVIRLAISSVFTAVKENHQKESPIKDLPKSIYEYVSNSSSANEVYRDKLRYVAEKIWISISDVCTDDILNPSSNISKD